MEASSSIHLSLDRLKAVDLALSLAVAPGGFHRCDDGIKVLLQAVRESNQRPDAGLRCGVNPMAHAICVLRGDGFAKIQSQEPHRSNDRTVYCHLLEQNPLLFRQMLCWSAR